MTLQKGWEKQREMLITAEPPRAAAMMEEEEETMTDARAGTMIVKNKPEEDPRRL